MKQIILILAILVRFCIGGCAGQDASYPSMVIWNGKNDAVSAEEVPPHRVFRELGEIRKQVVPMPERDRDLSVFPAGTKVYQLQDNEVQDAIAVRKGDGFVKAVPLH